MVAGMMRTLIQQALQENPVVVTGMGAFCAAGRTAAKLWQSAVAGRSPARWLDLPAGSQPPRIAACVAPAVDLAAPQFRHVRKMDRCVQLAHAAAAEAWQQAGLDTGRVSPARIGVIAGTSRGPIGKWAESARSLAQRRVRPSDAANSTIACLSGALSQTFHAHGPSFTVSAACASGAFAIALAAQQIATGAADVVLAGGAEAPLQPLVVAQLAAAGVLGHHDDPARTCRPFDRTRNGLLLGEGAAFLVLESAASARQHGAPILARLSGWAMGSDDGGRVGVMENGDGLLQVAGQALSLAGLEPAEVDHFNGHGTGTMINDRAEARAMALLLGGAVGRIPYSSTKPVTGHCVGATPALEAVICLGALRHQVVPPTIHCDEPDPACRLDLVREVSRPARLRHVVSHSLGFWSHHAALVFSAPA